MCYKYIQVIFLPQFCRIITIRTIGSDCPARISRIRCFVSGFATGWTNWQVQPRGCCWPSVPSWCTLSGSTCCCFWHAFMATAHPSIWLVSFYLGWWRTLCFMATRWCLVRRSCACGWTTARWESPLRRRRWFWGIRQVLFTGSSSRPGTWSLGCRWR